jgi:hypothetical protein
MICGYTCWFAAWIHSQSICTKTVLYDYQRNSMYFLKISINILNFICLSFPFLFFLLLLLCFVLFSLASLTFFCRYNLSDIGNLYSHLTNCSINKENPEIVNDSPFGIFCFFPPFLSPSPSLSLHSFSPLVTPSPLAPLSSFLLFLSLLSPLSLLYYFPSDLSLLFLSLITLHYCNNGF